MRRRRSKSRPLKLLAYFGSDIDSKSLAGAHRRGYTLLALDTVAIGSAAQANVPFTLMDDWVDGERILKTQEQAAKWEREWFLPAKEELTAEGVCWPEFDHHALFWFWRDITLAAALVEALKAEQLRELRLVWAPQPRPKLHYGRSDASAVFLRNELEGRVSLWRERSWRRALSRMRSAFARTRSKLGVLSRGGSGVSLQTPPLEKRVVSDPQIVNGRLVVAINPGEFHRFTAIVKQLSRSFPGRVAAALVQPMPHIAERIKITWKIPVIDMPNANGVSLAVGGSLLEGFVRAREAADTQFCRKALEHLSFHFEYYCRERWPKLAARLVWWADLWTDNPPAAVFVSSLTDAESQLPAVAAKRMSIPTFSLPHGALTRADRLEAVEHLLFELRLQRRRYERVGVAQERLIGVRDLEMRDEYPTEPVTIPAFDGAWRVLALTTSIQHQGCLAPIHSPAVQLAALNALANPPGDLVERLSLRFKPHPGFPQLELFLAVNSDVEPTILKPASELALALEESDLVLLVNNLGSALVHAARSGKPIIFFWPDPLTATPELHAEVVAEAGIVARTPTELWNLVRDFFTRPQMADDLRAKSRTFSHHFLDSSAYPAVARAVESRCVDLRVAKR